MNIAILCALSLLATAVGWWYLEYQDFHKVPAPSSKKMKNMEDASQEASSENAREQENGEETLHECPDQASQIPEEVTDDAQKQKSEAEKSPKGKFAPVPPKGKRLVYLILMLASLLILSVELTLVYESNTLLHNCRLIVLMAILFVAGNIDGRQKIIPNPIVLTGLGLRVLFWALEWIANPNKIKVIFMDDLWAIGLVVVFFIIGVLLVRGGMGMGDVKLMLVMGLFQGFTGVISALFCALFIMFILAIIVLITKKKSRKDTIAFAPAILLGTLLSVVLTGM